MEEDLEERGGGLGGEEGAERQIGRGIMNPFDISNEQCFDTQIFTYILFINTNFTNKNTHLKLQALDYCALSSAIMAKHSMRPVSTPGLISNMYAPSSQFEREATGSLTPFCRMMREVE